MGRAGPHYPRRNTRPNTPSNEKGRMAMPAFVEVASREELTDGRKLPQSKVIFGKGTTLLAGTTVKGSVSEDSHHRSGPHGWPKEKSTILGLLTSLQVADPKYGSSPGPSSPALNSPGSTSTRSEMISGELTEDQARNESPTG